MLTRYAWPTGRPYRLEEIDPAPRIPLGCIGASAVPRSQRSGRTVSGTKKPKLPPFGGEVRAHDFAIVRTAPNAAWGSATNACVPDQRWHRTASDQGGLKTFRMLNRAEIQHIWEQFQAGDSHLSDVLSIVLSFTSSSQVWAHSSVEHVLRSVVSH
jgi:hypothetical protein